MYTVGHGRCHSLSAVPMDVVGELAMAYLILSTFSLDNFGRPLFHLSSTVVVSVSFSNDISIATVSFDKEITEIS